MSTVLKAYKGDPKLRADFIREMKRHQRMDQIIKGTYGQGSNGDFKGCHIGCSIHSLAKLSGEKLDTSNHQLMQKYLGIPVELAYLFDGIFEGLPEEQAKNFPLRCSQAIKAGADLKMIVPHFLLWLLSDPTDGVIRFVQDARFARQKTAIETVAELHRREIAGKRVSADERDAAGAAAGDAAGAARAVWDAGDARAAAWAAGDAAWAAGAARAAGDAARIRQAEKLIELLKAA